MLSLKNSNLAILNSIVKFLSNKMHCHAAALHMMSTQAAKYPLWLIHLKITWLRQKAPGIQCLWQCGTPKIYCFLMDCLNSFISNNDQLWALSTNNHYIMIF